MIDWYRIYRRQRTHTSNWPVDKTPILSWSIDENEDKGKSVILMVWVCPIILMVEKHPINILAYLIVDEINNNKVMIRLVSFLLDKVDTLSVNQSYLM